MTVAELFATLGFKVDKSSLDGAKDSVDGLKSYITKALGALGIAFSVSALNSFKNECIQLGSDAEQMQEKFNTVFRGMEEEANAWAENYAEAIGRSTTKIKTYISDQQNLLVGFMGTDKRREAMEMAENMTSLALDLASFANTDEDTAVNAMTKAVMGETEAAKTLGAVLNDTTRAEAMATLGLQGKYDALDQATKMQVNYQAILTQSPDAVGDCARAMDSYESKQRQLMAAQQEYKTFVGMQLLPIQKQFVEWKLKATKAVLSLTKSILGENTENNKLQDLMNRLNPVFSAGEKILGTFGKAVKWLVDRLGGAENVFKIVAIAVGFFLAKLVYTKILLFVGAIKKLIAGFELAKLKILGALAVFVLIALVIEDFINFMQGNDSVIGSIFDALGIDSEKVRETVANAFEKVKEVVGGVLSAVGKFFSEYGVTILEFVKLLAVLGGAFTAFMGIVKIVGAAVAFLSTPFGAVIAIIALVIAAGVLLYQNWELITQKASELWQKVTDAFNNIRTAVLNALGNIASEASSKATAVSGLIINGFQVAVNWIQALPGKALQWGKDFINGFIQGIQNSIGKVTSTVSNVAQKVANFLHFSRPDEGPLKDYETWMPDMMKGMANGIRTAKSLVTDQIGSLAVDLATLVQAGSASSQAVASNSISNSRTSNVNQYNQFNNSYTGSQAEAGGVSKGMHKSAVDATTYLARSLAISRG